jgi:hypothetical protein
MQLGAWMQLRRPLRVARRRGRLAIAALLLAACSKSEPTGTAATHDASAKARAARPAGLSDAGATSPTQASDAGSPTRASRDATPAPAAGSPVDGSAASNSAATGATDAGTPAANSCQSCSAYAEPVQTGTIGVSELDALSGLASSRKNAGIVFAHNDHNRPVVYALDLEGKLHATITLARAPSSDIEDIAVGPCGDQQCVYLADIGDNASMRAEYAILRFPEPSVPAAPGDDAQSPSFERFRFTYEDGSHNAEGLMVSPAGTLYIVTKLAEAGVSSVYRLPTPLAADSVARAVKIATLPIPSASDMAASAAAAHPCGLGFLVRVYNRVYEFKTPTGADFEAAFSVMPTSVAMPNEKQSEGIDYLPDGRGFISSGEGAAAPIFRTSCQ